MKQARFYVGLAAFLILNLFPSTASAQFNDVILDASTYTDFRIGENDRVIGTVSLEYIRQVKEQVVLDATYTLDLLEAPFTKLINPDWFTPFNSVENCLILVDSTILGFPTGGRMRNCVTIGIGNNPQGFTTETSTAIVENNVCLGFNTGVGIQAGGEGGSNIRRNLLGWCLTGLFASVKANIGDASQAGNNIFYRNDINVWLNSGAGVIPAELNWWYDDQGAFLEAEDDIRATVFFDTKGVPKGPGGAEIDVVPFYTRGFATENPLSVSSWRLFEP